MNFYRTSLSTQQECLLDCVPGGDADFHDAVFVWNDKAWHHQSFKMFFTQLVVTKDSPHPTLPFHNETFLYAIVNDLFFSSWLHKADCQVELIDKRAWALSTVCFKSKQMYFGHFPIVIWKVETLSFGSCFSVNSLLLSVGMKLCILRIRWKMIGFLLLREEIF